ncbi:hypothetical protein Murmansk-011 [Murmansk poxvirus]|uniref:Uncharacterized protein n=1 Tax=Murmansk poxvirus TaxID=2025359 RepID=A0A223FMK0_9POXV|nr:hypothetical protein CKM52_gp011 [Murmansk poxvirus]AST09206.1 hypothetical protein Murmansk-011 [Murmansk poxvirus]
MKIITFLAIVSTISAASVPKLTDRLFNNVEVAVFMAPYIKGNYSIESHEEFHIVITENWNVTIFPVDLDIPLIDIIYHPRVSQDTAFIKLTFDSKKVFQNKENDMIIYIDCKEIEDSYKFLLLNKVSSPKNFRRYSADSVYYLGKCFNFVSARITYTNTETGAKDVYYYNSKKFDYVKEADEIDSDE